jgi:hypothetical protein
LDFLPISYMHSSSPPFELYALRLLYIIFAFLRQRRCKCNRM